jgi:CubicO group peptidase (beta-lactamase class C family)
MESVAFLVIQDGELVFEKYWQGYGPESLTSSFSMANVIVSLLVGAAIEEGRLKGVDQTLGELLPEYGGTEKGRISIRHLLTMSSGLQYAEGYSNPLADSAESYYTSDLSAQATAIRVAHEPGKQYEYQSCNQIFLALILRKVTGMEVSDYASEKLWKPMGAEHTATWSLDREGGLEKAYCCFNSNARDFARIGQLYLNGGTWNGVRVVSEKYLKESVTPTMLPTVEGKVRDDYGFSWRMMTQGGLPAFYASGILGQFIVAVPEKRAVIVRLGKKYFPRGHQRRYDDVRFYIDAGVRMVEGRGM